jgi:uncharacterized protein involved in propanediol utilization
VGGGTALTPEEHIAIANATIQVDRMLKSTIPMVEVLAKAATDVEATGLAMAAWFMRDSMIVYAKEMKAFLLSLDEEEYLDDQTTD